MSQKRDEVSKEVIDRLVNLSLVALGNILVIIGENLIEKGTSGLGPETKEKKHKEKK